MYTVHQWNILTYNSRFPISFNYFEITLSFPPESLVIIRHFVFKIRSVSPLSASSVLSLSSPIDFGSSTLLSNYVILPHCTPMASSEVFENGLRRLHRIVCRYVTIPVHEVWNLIPYTHMTQNAISRICVQRFIDFLCVVFSPLCLTLQYRLSNG